MNNVCQHLVAVIMDPVSHGQLGRPPARNGPRTLVSRSGRARLVTMEKFALHLLISRRQRVDVKRKGPDHKGEVHQAHLSEVSTSNDSPGGIVVATVEHF